MLSELATLPVGTALSAVAHSAKKKLQDSATTVGDNALVKVAAQVLLTPLTASRVDDDLARACGSREDRAVVKFARDFLLGDAAVRDALALAASLGAYLESASVANDEARWLASMQFAARLKLWRPWTRTAGELQWLERVAALVVDGAPTSEGDAAVLANVEPLLAIGREVPLELYEAVQRQVDRFVRGAAAKHVLPLLRLTEGIERRVDARIRRRQGRRRARQRARVRARRDVRARTRCPWSNLPRSPRWTLRRRCCTWA